MRRRKRGDEEAETRRTRSTTRRMAARGSLFAFLCVCPHLRDVHGYCRALRFACPSVGLDRPRVLAQHELLRALDRHAPVQVNEHPRRAGRMRNQSRAARPSSI